LINIKVYKNGYEIIGHAEEKICHQVSLWHWLGSNILLGSDKGTKEYSSIRDNSDNPNEGYSWVVFNPNISHLKWIFDDLVISMERWAEESYKDDEVTIEKIDNILEK
jgi:hypothetical protein